MSKCKQRDDDVGYHYENQSNHRKRVTLTANTSGRNYFPWNNFAQSDFGGFGNWN